MMKKQVVSSVRALGALAVVQVAFQSSAAAQSQPAVQWRVEDGGNGHWYAQTSFGTLSSWSAANDHATIRGAHLATIGDRHEQDFVASISLVGTCETWGGMIWLGGRQLPGFPPSEGWQWVTNEPWTFTNWAPGEPNDFDGWAEDRLCMYASTGKWNDGTDQASSFSCNFAAMLEWSADCNADGIVDYGQCHDGTLADFNGNNIPDCCERGEACVVGNYPVQSRIADGGNGHWYQRIDTNQRIFWETAKSRAQSLGGYLACLETPAENSWVWDAVINVGQDSPSEFAGWIGLYQLPGSAEPRGGWMWLTGSPLNYFEFAAFDNAIGFGPEQYGCYYRTPTYDSATWADNNAGGCWVNDCETSFVIEWSADCNHDTIVDYGQILTGQLADSNANGVPDICEGPTCRDADLFRNGIINGADLGILLSEWGPAPANTVSDINRDGRVDGSDLGLLLSFWGPCSG